MPLPELTVPRYKMTLPSNGKTVSYRPFLVKEEKILHIAMESESLDSIMMALEQIINNCVEGDIDLPNTPMFDLEYMLLQIRSKSIGEIVKPVITCSKCQHQSEIAMDINKAKVIGEVKSDDDNKIQISDEIGVVMSYPTMASVTKGLKRSGEDTGDDSLVEDLVHSITDNMKYIYDSSEVYNCRECSDEELVKFVDSLTKEQFNKITEFFLTIPKVILEKSHKCEKCGAEENVEVEGMQNFFG